MSIDTIEDLTALFSDLPNVFAAFSGASVHDFDRLKKSDNSYGPVTKLNLVFNRGMVSPAARSRRSHPQTAMLGTFITSVLKGKGIQQVAEPIIADGGTYSE